MTQIMRVDLCGISQLLQFLTIKWDIPADPFIEAHSELQDGEFIISWPLTAVESHQLFFFFVDVFVSLPFFLYLLLIISLFKLHNTQRIYSCS